MSTSTGEPSPQQPIISYIIGFPFCLGIKLTMSGFQYLRSEIEATFWFHNFLQDKGFDSCTANIFIHHPMLQMGVIHSQADERGFFTNDQWRSNSLWCLGWNQSKSLEVSGSTCEHRPAQARETCWEKLLNAETQPLAQGVSRTMYCWRLREYSKEDICCWPLMETVTEV